ncbi:DUF2569 domain-containing protein [Sphingomicrobium sediminis]|uniref:DUF2569 domain-containing protein n=1 Tax=Sphingomicrobium sediminis TaxID=2950949 RepID=A0A9X2EH69_9SPHN|nr:DUF2569 domain-containing protein [Sphingomicrobium sediminis]MCM8557968.1 DUF2569 domain-containing protein [Sphingomicrobium sediminis]
MTARVHAQVQSIAETMSQRFSRRAAAILAGLEGSLTKVALAWMLLAMSACSIRVVASPTMGQVQGLATYFPYILVTLGPVASLFIALRLFRGGENMARPTSHLARLGRWKRVSVEQARAHELYGTGGIMVSLLIGMMINVPVRVAEYLVSIPAIPPVAPDWLATLHFMMTLDVVLLTSLYMVAFVAALKKVPWFPMFLACVWALDLAMQMGVAEAVKMTGLPGTVVDPLQTLLTGNTKKVLISAALWAPYLLLSKRVNVTYRQRVEAN